MIEKNVLRNLVLEFLEKQPETQMVNVINSVESLVKQHDLFPTEEDCRQLGIDYHYYQQGNLNPFDNLNIKEIVWDLITERIITPGYRNNPDAGFPHIRLTEFGKTYVSQSAPHYYDPQGYMKSLKAIVQNIDPVIEQYIFESLNCFRQQLLFASAVMLGAAAEKALLLLLEAISNSMSNQAKQKKAVQLLDRPRLPDIYDTIRKNIDSVTQASLMPYSIHQGNTEHLLSLFEMIRVQRNEAVHPIHSQVDRNKVFLSIQSTPVALESIYRLMDWFKNNPIP